MTEEQVEQVSQIASLITKSIQDTISPSERVELDAWLNCDGDHYLLYEEFMNSQSLCDSLEIFQQCNNQEAAWKKLATKLAAIRKITSVSTSIIVLLPLL